MAGSSLVWSMFTLTREPSARPAVLGGEAPRGPGAPPPGGGHGDPLAWAGRRPTTMVRDRPGPSQGLACRPLARSGGRLLRGRWPAGSAGAASRAGRPPGGRHRLGQAGRRLDRPGPGGDHRRGGTAGPRSRRANRRPLPGPGQLPRCCGGGCRQHRARSAPGSVAAGPDGGRGHRARAHPLLLLVRGPRGCRPRALRAPRPLAGRDRGHGADGRGRLRGRVRILAGTDASELHGRVAAEVRALAEAGLPSRDALGAASWTARAFLGLGGLEEGALADAVAYDWDPRSDLGVLDSPLRVILGGRVVR